MDKECESPLCDEVLIRKKKESYNNFNKRRHCDMKCARDKRKYGPKRDMSAVRRALFDSGHPVGLNPEKPKPRKNWSPGGSVVVHCEDCAWIVGWVATKTNVCRVKIDPIDQWGESSNCRWQSWALDHRD